MICIRHDLLSDVRHGRDAAPAASVHVLKFPGAV
jgi:hypothetical protein